MNVLIGECTGRLATEAQRLGWGRMWISRSRNICTYHGEPWGLDNGAFRDWATGKPFDGDCYKRVLDKAVLVPEPPMLVVLPDIPGGGAQSLELSASWVDKVPDWPLYLAVQDGMTKRDVDAANLPLSGVFLGGTNAWKSTARMWCDWAHARGLNFHYGRAGTQEKVRHAMHVGADSLDSAFPMWTRERWSLFVRWVTRGPCQRDLFMDSLTNQGGER